MTPDQNDHDQNDRDRNVPDPNDRDRNVPDPNDRDQNDLDPVVTVNSSYLSIKRKLVVHSSSTHEVYMFTIVMFLFFM